MFNPANDAVLLGDLNENLVVFQLLGGRLCDENMKAALKSIKSDGEMGAFKRSIRSVQVEGRETYCRG